MYVGLSYLVQPATPQKKTNFQNEFTEQTGVALSCRELEKYQNVCFTAGCRLCAALKAIGIDAACDYASPRRW